jgi:hypothetical protein
VVGRRVRSCSEYLLNSTMYAAPGHLVYRTSSPDCGLGCRVLNGGAVEGPRVTRRRGAVDRAPVVLPTRQGPRLSIGSTIESLEDGRSSQGLDIMSREAYVFSTPGAQLLYAAPSVTGGYRQVFFTGPHPEDHIAGPPHVGVHVPGALRVGLQGDGEGSVSRKAPKSAHKVTWCSIQERCICCQ